MSAFHLCVRPRFAHQQVCAHRNAARAPSTRGCAASARRPPAPVGQESRAGDTAECSGGELWHPGSRWARTRAQPSLLSLSKWPWLGWEVLCTPTWPIWLPRRSAKGGVRVKERADALLFLQHPKGLVHRNDLPWPDWRWCSHHPAPTAPTATQAGGSGAPCQALAAEGPQGTVP